MCWLKLMLMKEKNQNDQHKVYKFMKQEIDEVGFHKKRKFVALYCTNTSINSAEY